MRAEVKTVGRRIELQRTMICNCARVRSPARHWLSNEGFCWSVSEKHKAEQPQIEWFRFILLLSLSASLIVPDKR